MKKSATFGLSTLVKNPCTNTVPGDMGAKFLLIASGAMGDRSNEIPM